MPTARGWTVLAASGILLVLGLTVGYRELAAVAGAGLLAVIVAAGWVGLPPRLVVDRTVEPQRVGRGDPCRAVIDLRATGRGTRVLTVADRIDGPAGVRAIAVPPIRVRGVIPARTGYDLPTDRRGLLTVGPMRVTRRDLFGLCGTDRPIGPTAHLLVRPRWHVLRGVPLGVSPSLDGVADAALHGSITFHSLREYNLGDDLRQVHWRTSARVGALMVREHIDTALPRLVLLVDDRAESYLDDAASVEEAVEAAASILVAGGQAGLPVALRLASGPRSTDESGTVARSRPARPRTDAKPAAPPTESRLTLGAGLDLLAQAQPVTGVDLSTTMHRLRMESAGDTLVFVTGPHADLPAVLAARTGYARLVVVVLGATTAAQPPADVTMVIARTAREFVDIWNGMLR